MYGFVVTTAGLGMLAQAGAGETLTITGVQVGKGVAASQSAALALTALIDPVAAATSSEPVVAGGQLSMIVEYRNDMDGGLEAGFALSEFGIFARVGSGSPALLYYASLGDSPQPVQAEAEGLDIHRFPVAIAVTGEVAVTLDYPAGAFVTSDALDDYIPNSQKGVAGGLATLGSDGKVPQEQLPEMDYDPAGSAEAKVADHNTSNSAHQDIRALVSTAAVTFTASQWTGEDTKTLSIPKTSHGRQTDKFGYTLYHLVSSAYKRNTWAVRCTDVSYDADTQAITLTGEDAYDGKIVFFAG